MHQQIDGVGITAVIIQRVHIFGGFAVAKWTNDDVPVTDSP